jgi:putative transcriptional regulator
MVRPLDLLIAPPHMTSQEFRQTVLLVTHHTSTGTYALVLNRPMTVCLDELTLPADYSLPLLPPLPLYAGGPVGASSLWMLHTDEWRTEGTIALGAGWALSSSLPMLQTLGLGHTPREFRMVMGYSAWMPGQLAQELTRRDHNTWLTATSPAADLLMTVPVEELWSHAVELSALQAVDTWL